MEPVETRLSGTLPHRAGGLQATSDPALQEAADRGQRRQAPRLQRALPCSGSASSGRPRTSTSRRDREDWHERFDDEERFQRMYGLSSFFIGEQKVAEELGPIMRAAPTEEQRIFLCTQIADEARHVRFFERFYQEVGVYESSELAELLEQTSEHLNDNFGRLFDEMLEAASTGSSAEPEDTEALVEAITLYHMVIEGMLALTGQHFIMDYNEQRGDAARLRRGLPERRPRRAPPRRLRLGLPAREGARGRPLQAGDPAHPGGVAAGRRRRALTAMGAGGRGLGDVRLHARRDARVRRHLPDAAPQGHRPALSAAGRPCREALPGECSPLGGGGVPAGCTTVRAERPDLARGAGAGAGWWLSEPGRRRSRARERIADRSGAGCRSSERARGRSRRAGPRRSGGLLGPRAGRRPARWRQARRPRSRARRGNHRGHRLGSGDRHRSLGDRGGHCAGWTGSCDDDGLAAGVADRLRRRDRRDAARRRRAPGRRSRTRCSTSTAPAVSTAAVTTPATALAPIVPPTAPSPPARPLRRRAPAPSAPAPPHRCLPRRAAPAPAPAPPAPARGWHRRRRGRAWRREGLEGEQRPDRGQRGQRLGVGADLLRKSPHSSHSRTWRRTGPARPCAGPRRPRRARGGPRRRSAGAPGWPRRARSGRGPAAT